MWTGLLNAEPGTWLHYPLPQTYISDSETRGLYWGLHSLAEYWEKDHQLRASPLFLEYLHALKLRGVVLETPAISRFLSVTEAYNINFGRGGPFVPVGTALARTVLDCFPLAQSMPTNLRSQYSADIAMPITQWPMDNPDRLSCHGDASRARTRCRR